VIEQFIEEEVGLYLESDLPEIRAIYQQQRAAFYEGELKKLANVTVLDQHNTSQIFEHSFDIPCYQTKLAERISHYKNLQSKSDKQLSSVLFALGALC
jgi:hypothetical protein